LGPLDMIITLISLSSKIMKQILGSSSIKFSRWAQ
jgi:hypothetical protein